MSDQETSEKKAWVNSQRKTLMVGAPVLILGFILTFYILNRHYQSTDDAYIQAGQVQISCNVSGRVTSIDVKDNQKVKIGDLLFQIDEQPFKIAVDEAKAHLANAQLQVMALKSTYQQAKANEQAADNALHYQSRELKRQKALVSKGIISKSQFDQFYL